MKKMLIYFFLLLNTSSIAQNLVPNPSFEMYDTCPNAVSQIYRAIPWFQPSWGTPDYFNICTLSAVHVPDNFFGFQNPHLGNAYAGIFASVVYYDSVFPNYREYIEVKLNDTLIANQTYFISFFVSLADSMNYATDDIAVYFSIDTVKNDTGYFLSVIPQIENFSGNFLADKISWTKISGNFIAQGNEQFLTIGNFKDRYNTDTVSVIGGSANIGQSDYWGGYYYVDDICVSTDSLYCANWTVINESPFGYTGLHIYPNPSNEILHIENLREVSYYLIINAMGETVTSGSLERQDNQISTSSFSSGLYFLSINNQYFYKLIINH